LTTLLREWFPGVRPPWWRIAVYLAGVLLTTALVRPDLYSISPRFLLEDYSIVSLDLAMTRAFCGTPSAVTPLVSVATVVRDHREFGETPARQIAADRAAGLQRFCDTATVLTINNENSLMWLDSWLWRLAPDLSINGLARVLHSMRVAGLALVFALLLANRFGVVVAAISWLWALTLLQDLAGYVHHGYPFMLVLLLVTSVSYATLGQTGVMHSRIGAVVVAAIVGAWTAFAANMRTSHLPVYAIFAILLFVFSERTATTTRPDRWRRLGLAAAGVIAGYAAFQYLAISRHLPDVDQALSRHTILHSTVIALAIPESDFSRREGITWSDGAANAIALREQPGVAYLSVEYENALFKYYARLWRERTSEMLTVYLLKGQTAGKHMLEVLRGRTGREGVIVNTALAPLDWLPNGFWLLSLYTGVAVTSWFRAWRRPGSAIALVYLAAAAVLLQIEATIVMSNYVVNYQSYLAFFCIFATAAAPAALLGAIWDRVTWLDGRRDPAAAAGVA
jgi:hypothetical protein